MKPQRVAVIAPDATSRVPVLAFCDALGALCGAEVRLIDPDSDAAIDAALTDLYGDAKPLEEPSYPADVRLVVAGGDGVLRAVVRRAMRRVAPPPSKRPDWLQVPRTIGDLPPVGVLPLIAEDRSLAAALGLPTAPDAVAAAVVAGRVTRRDVLRNDHSSATVHGVALGDADDIGRPVPWRVRVSVDAAELADGTEPVVACVVTVGDGYRELGELSLFSQVRPGVVSAAVVVATSTGVEVRRAAGRAVAVDPASEVSYTDDGVAGTLSRKKTWWVEPAAWAVYGD